MGGGVSVGPAATRLICDKKRAVAQQRGSAAGQERYGY